MLLCTKRRCPQETEDVAQLLSICLACTGPVLHPQYQKRKKERKRERKKERKKSSVLVS
jgi:hypothetical protein